MPMLLRGKLLLHSVVFTLLLLYPASGNVIAQSKKMPLANPSALLMPAQPEQDCIHAIPLCNNSYVQQNSYSGQGQIPNEINPALSCLTTGERNDVWYTFIVQQSGNLNFSITPMNANDDYDWAVFNLTGKSCSMIFTDSAMEVSCNFSANTGCGGVTGPNGLTAGFCGQQNEAVIPVVAGETYVINVSNFSASQSGYAVDFSLSTAVIYDLVAPQGMPLSAGCTQSSLNVQFNEQIDCNSFSDPVTEFKLVESTGFVFGIQSVTIPGCNNSSSANQIIINLYSPIDKTTTAYLIAMSGSDNNTFSDVCGNFVSAGDTVAAIAVVNDATVNLGSDISVCPDANMPLLNAQNPNAAVYQWLFNGTIVSGNSQSFQTTNAGTYGVNVIYGSGCFTSDSMQITMLPAPSVNLGSDTTICENSKMPLLDAGNPGAQYTWFLNGNLLHIAQQTYLPQQPGIFSVSVNGTFCSSADSLEINFFTPLVIQLADAETICNGDSLIIDATQQGAQTYSWSFNSYYFSYQPLITVYDPGKYFLTVTDMNQCESVDSVTISPVTIPGVPVVTCPINYGSYLEFSWTAVADAAGYEVSEDGGISWIYPVSGENGNSHRTGISVTAIKVRALSEGNCKSGPEAVSQQCDIQISNVVTPNNDGRNDAFLIANIEQYPNTSVTVLNRYGTEVYKNPDYKNNWIPAGLPAGTYYYIVSFPDSRAMKGNLTIFK